jgi:chromosomal replication initiator protein
MVAMYIARAYTKFSLMQIGDRLNRDHTTVVSAVAKVKKLVEQRDDVIGDIEMIRRMLDL